MKRLVFLLLFLMLITFFSHFACADLINPYYYNTTCKAGEVEVECTYSKCQDIFGGFSNCNDQCSALRNNPSFRFLVAEGHSLGGREKWCGPYYLNSNSLQILDFLTYLLLTIFLELIAGWAYTFIRKGNFKKIAPVIIIGNVISYPIVFYGVPILFEVLGNSEIFNPYATTSSSLYSFFIVSEAFAIIIEFVTCPPLKVGFLLHRRCHCNISLQ